MIYDTPTVKYPASSLFHLQSMSTMVENPFNPAVQVAEGDDYWTGEVEYQNLDRSQVIAFRNFIQKLRGTAGEFWFIDYTHIQQGAWLGGAAVDGANQDGTLLAIRSAQPGILLAPAGDRFQLGETLFELQKDIITDSSGEAELEFLPDIRVIPADGAVLITDTPRAKCMLMPKQRPPQPTTKGLLSSFKYKFRESLRA